MSSTVLPVGWNGSSPNAILAAAAPCRGHTPIVTCNHPLSPVSTCCHLPAPAVTCHCSSSPAPTHSLPAPSATSQLFPAPFPPLPIPAVLGTTLHDLMPCPYLSRSPCGWRGMMGYLPAPCPALSRPAFRAGYVLPTTTPCSLRPVS